MKEDRLSGLALMYIQKHNVFLNSENIVDDFASSGSWPIVPLSQMARGKAAILILISSHDLALVKRRHFYEPF